MMEAKFTKRDLIDAWNAGVRRLSYENAKKRENEIWVAETPLEKEEWIDLKDKDVEQSPETGQHETKTWKYFGDCCPRCGDGAEVYTDSEEAGYFFEDDDARCVGCGLTGGVIISESHGAGISWA